MEKIALPKKIDFKETGEAHRGLITIEPLFAGYGMTLGNSLRRVLLSSLPGASVVGVKIKGAGHEFTTLPNIKEDILEIMLNLKQLRLKMFVEEEVKLELSVSGKKKITAGDIKKNSAVEIVNPDLEIANITDAAGSLDLEIYVNVGRGYRMVESGKKNAEIGYIEIDSIFSPILAVSINVENVRVGKMTNWDRLVIDMTTDGTISSADAFKESVKILVDQFTSLISEAPAEEVVKEETVEVEPEIVADEEIKKTKKKVVKTK